MEADAQRTRSGRLRWAIALALAAVVALVLPVSLPLLLSVKAPTPPPIGHLDALAALGGGGFAVHVVVGDGPSVWLTSHDGGATWSKAELPEDAHQHSHDDRLQCTAGLVCFLLRDQERDGVVSHHIDRIERDRTWYREATFDEVCRTAQLTLDEKDGSRAIVTCGGTTIAYRAAGGIWHLLDVESAAR